MSSPVIGKERIRKKMRRKVVFGFLYSTFTMFYFVSFFPQYLFENGRRMFLKVDGT